MTGRRQATRARHACQAAVSRRHAEVSGDGLANRVRIPVRCELELAAQRPSPAALYSAPQGDDLGDRIARAADDDLLAVLHPFDNPRQVGLRLVDVELRG